MKVIKALGVLFLCGMLSGCGIISDVAYDTTDAVQTAVKKKKAAEFKRCPYGEC